MEEDSSERERERERERKSALEALDIARVSRSFLKVRPKELNHE